MVRVLNCSFRKQIIKNTRVRHGGSHLQFQYSKKVKKENGKFETNLGYIPRPYLKPTAKASDIIPNTI
jgi:hypothetical protein